MDAPEGAPSWLEVWTAAERPDLWELAREDGALDAVWPEYNRHGVEVPKYFGVLVPRFASMQAVLVDHRTGQVVGRARTIPFRWDGSLSDLPPGIDALGLRAVGDEAGTPSTLSALAAEVEPGYQGQGLSVVVLKAMRRLARVHGFETLVAPVRPSQKDRYPLTPIGQYASWCREDGLLFDPWLRTHARLGARMLRAEGRSLHVMAPVADWEAWIGMALPADGQYVFPGGLAPVTVSKGVGYYWEPNVWMQHGVS